MLNNKTIKVGLVGLGTVGKGTIEVLCRNSTEITRRLGVNIIITDVVSRDFYKTQEVIQEMNLNLANPIKIHKNALDIVNSDIDILIELIGGCDISKKVIIQGIKNKKHIVTANKALLAKHGQEIFDLAMQYNVMVNFEAAVCGGIPIVKAIKEGLSANKIKSIAGIVNGTSNYILSCMNFDQLSFDQALKKAQEKGYAEHDPKFDIQGIDAGHKISILAAIAFGVPINFNQAYIEGIDQLQTIDLLYAEELGYKVKLLSIAKNSEFGGKNNSIELRVCPSLVNKDHILAHVNYAMNAVLVEGDAVGETLYYGKGAGAEATASAVIADLVDIVRSINNKKDYRVPYLAFQDKHVLDTTISNIKDIKTNYYIRVSAEDKTGLIAIIAQELAKNNISIKHISQKNTHGNSNANIILITHLAQEKFIDYSIEKIKLKIDFTEIIKLRIDFI